MPTPLTPARNAPTPVPPPSPGPRPPPEPLPIPPDSPVPIPPPPPGPPEKFTVAASGSPIFVSGGLATRKSGGPRSDGSIANFGFGFLSVASGGVNCVHLNFGARPFVAGNCERSPPPPPPPALSAPAGSFETYGEISSGITSICLFFASTGVDTGGKKIGTNSSPMTTPCKPTASAWLVPKFSSFDQISFTFTGFTAKGSGACFGGEKNSRMRSPNPPKFAPQATASLLFTGPLGAGLELKKSLRLSPTPVPKVVCVNGASLRSRTLTGRSIRNCLRFDQKLSGMRISGLANLGTAEAGTGTEG